MPLELDDVRAIVHDAIERADAIFSKVHEAMNLEPDFTKAIILWRGGPRRPSASDLIAEVKMDALTLSGTLRAGEKMLAEIEDGKQPIQPIAPDEYGRDDVRRLLQSLIHSLYGIPHELWQPRMSAALELAHKLVPDWDFEVLT